jgi:hypothetical protein
MELTMSKENITPKFGIVAILDALGASDFPEEKINAFLKSRAEIINAAIKERGEKLTSIEPEFRTPSVYMFGDSVIVTLELDEHKKTSGCILGFAIIMSQFLFLSMQHRILFRGAFSIGNYIEDANTNTVMGKAVSDAAAWYEKSDWMGLSCTPKTKYVLEHFCGTSPFSDYGNFLFEYPVPIKEGKLMNLYTIPWPRLFFSKKKMEKHHKEDSGKWFVEVIKDFDIPFGTETKYENINKYFTACAEVERKQLDGL